MVSRSLKGILICICLLTGNTEDILKQLLFVFLLRTACSFILLVDKFIFSSFVFNFCRSEYILDINPPFEV